MARPTTKTPQEIAANAMAAAERARLRAVKAETSDNPLVASLQKELDTYNKDIAALSRKLTGKNSFANRIANAEARMRWILAEEAETKAKDSLYRATKDYLQHSMADLAIRVSEGKAVTNDDVATILANVPTLPILASLTLETERLSKEWRALTQAQDAGEAPVATAEGV